MVAPVPEVLRLVYLSDRGQNYGKVSIYVEIQGVRKGLHKTTLFLLGRKSSFALMQIPESLNIRS